MSLSYTATPFQPTNPYPNQVTTELNLANQNFTTLAQAFVNADPTSLTVVNSASVGGYGVSATPTPNTLLPLNANAQFPFSVLPAGVGNGYANPINLTSATADYMLQPGQVAYISFTNATSVPLYIATTNGTYYEMVLTLSNSSNTGAVGAPIYLIQNNTTYSNGFLFVECYNILGGSAPNLYSATYSAFRVSWAVTSAKIYITNFTTNKNIITFYNETGFSGLDISIASCLWNDTTTSWTSLGTITLPQATSGYVLVRRLA
jgi:hypothetical protein